MPLLFPEEGMGILDSLIFASPQPLSITDIYRLTGFDQEVVKQLLTQLQEVYRQPGHGIELVEVAGGYQLRTSPRFHDYIQKLQQSRVRVPTLSHPALETLSIIAYRQPVTRAQVEAVRGVKVDHLLATLLERGLIAEAGRVDGPGRPLLYVTTPAFLELFGLKSLDDLPPLGDLT